MKRMSKGAEKDLNSAVELLREKKAAIEAAIERFNEEVDKLKDDVNGAVEDYNTAREAALAIVEEVKDSAQSYYDDRTEKWQEGDKGQEYSEWCTALDNVNSDGLEVEFPDDLEAPEMNDADEFEALPHAPGE